MKHIVKITALALTLGVTSLTSAVAGEAVVAFSKTEQQTVTFAIDKMTCALCPITVRKAMEQVDGVGEVKVDFDTKKATVTFDPSVATIEAIATASTNAGYPATAE